MTCAYMYISSNLKDYDYFSTQTLTNTILCNVYNNQRDDYYTLCTYPSRRKDYLRVRQSCDLLEIIMSSYSKKAQVVYFFVCVAYLLLFCQRIFAHLLYLPASYTSYQTTVIREREREREKGEK